MRAGVTVAARIGLGALLLAGGGVMAATFEVDYVAPATGAYLIVSAPEPASTAYVVFILQDKYSKTAAVLGNGMYRMNRIIADGRKHPKVAANPKAKALPSEAELKVPVGERTTFVVRSHDELVSGSPFSTYTTASCGIPFTFSAREGYRYKAIYKKTSEYCTLEVTERAVEPADAPETPLASLEQPTQVK